jgi:hypothetical protein
MITKYRLTYEQFLEEIKKGPVTFYWAGTSEVHKSKVSMSFRNPRVMVALTGLTSRHRSIFMYKSVDKLKYFFEMEPNSYTNYWFAYAELCMRKRK